MFVRRWFAVGAAAVAGAHFVAACAGDSAGSMSSVGEGNGGAVVNGAGGGTAGLGGTTATGGSTATGGTTATGAGGGGGSSVHPDAGPEGGGSTRADAAPDGRADGASDNDRSDGAAAVEPSGTFVAVGYGGRTVRSIDDGRSWIDDAQLTPNGGDDHMLLRTVTFGAGGFVALGYRSMTSPDGHSWVDHGDQNLDQWIGAVVYAPGAFVAVGGYGLRATSADGVTWTNRPIDTVASHEAQRLAFDAQGGRFVSANDDGRLSYSADGRTWQFAGGTTPTINEVAFGNGVFVGVGSSAAVLSRDGGSTWASATGLTGTTQGLVFAQGHFTAIASGHVFTSVDGTAWVDHPVTGIMGGALAYGHGSYVLVRGTSRRRSSDGISWDSAVSGGTNELVWVAFGATH